MDWMNLIESLTRWIHVISGITWIGLLYFFNWVNGPFAATLDGDTKKKVVPELMPRALWWFRWGAAWTWFSGVLLLFLVYYHIPSGAERNPNLFMEDVGWSAFPVLMVAIVFLGVFVYDALVKTVLNTPQLQFFGGWILASLAVYAMKWAGFEFRGYAIHLGAMFGTFMAFNVWFRIWPAQQRIITATKSGEKPDPADPAMAGLRSKHNTYMSIPLVFAMVSQHGTWAAAGPWAISLVILVGWYVCTMLYSKSKKIPGF